MKVAGLKVCQLCAVDFTLKHFLLPLIDGMRREGWQVVSVCSQGGHIEELRRRGYPVIVTPISRSLNLFAHLISVWRLYRIFRNERFDILHAHTPIAALIGRIAGRLAGIPLIIYTAHGFYFHDEMPAWKQRAFVALERVGGWFNDLLFTQSAEDAEAAVREKIAVARDVMAIGNGVDPARFRPRSLDEIEEVRASLDIPKSALVVGMVGRMVREKGCPEFLAAARELAGQFPDACFLLVGGRLASDHNDPVEDDLAEARAVLGNRLITTGFRSDIPDLMAAMDVFCLPSHREGMPRTIIEAMMMGKPVVATDIRGAREEVVHGRTGLLVPTRAPRQLAEAIGSLLANPEMREGMGRQGRLRALDLYDESKVVALQINTIRHYAKQGGLL